MGIIIATFIVTLALDLVTKQLIISRLALHESVPIIENVFHLTYIRNEGAAFGILQGYTTFFIVITIFVLIGFIYLYQQLSLEYIVNKLGLGLALGGIIGNLIDRLRWGYVVDFLDFQVWPIFNIADSAIVVAVIIFSYWLLIVEPKELN